PRSGTSAALQGGIARAAPETARGVPPESRGRIEFCADCGAAEDHREHGGEAWRQGHAVPGRLDGPTGWCGMNGSAANESTKPPRMARAEAAVWLMRLHGKAHTADMEAGLRRWLQEDPENARQFEHMTDVWELGNAVDISGLPRMRPPMSPSGRRA